MRFFRTPRVGLLLHSLYYNSSGRMGHYFSPTGQAFQCPTRRVQLETQDRLCDFLGSTDVPSSRWGASVSSTQPTASRLCITFRFDSVQLLASLSSGNRRRCRVRFGGYVVSVTQLLGPLLTVQVVVGRDT